MPDKLTSLGAEMVAGLEAFRDCLQNGEPIESRFRVDAVALTERSMGVIKAAIERGDTRNIPALRVAFRRHNETTEKRA